MFVFEIHHLVPFSASTSPSAPLYLSLVIPDHLFVIDINRVLRSRLPRHRQIQHSVAVYQDFRRIGRPLASCSEPDDVLGSRACAAVSSAAVLRLRPLYFSVLDASTLRMTCIITAQPAGIKGRRIARSTDTTGNFSCILYACHPPCPLRR